MVLDDIPSVRSTCSVVFSFIPLVIGMFGLPQVMELMSKKDEGDILTTGPRLTLKESILTKEELKRIIPTAIKSAILGNFVGFLPGAGGTTASFLSYVMEKKTGKNEKEMGNGALEGVAASEAANNAAAVGAFAPPCSHWVFQVLVLQRCCSVV